ncbi:hypothetical protein DV735_g2800, partial [Chaetothyriales sp. CBS 134920]
MAETDGQVIPSKRALEVLGEAEAEVSAAKRRKIPYHHHHFIHHRQQQWPAAEPAFVEPESVDKLLIDSIKTVIEEEALKHNVQDPAIESMALEGLYGAVNEFILSFCALVRRSMQAARRTVPIAPDFEAAIYELGLPRPDDQIAAYQTKPPINTRLYPTPPPEDSFHGTHELPSDFLGAELDGRAALERFTYNTAALPPLPSAHTYKATVVYDQRETDSRRIRELATEEGKLGEQALRKLAGAVKIGAAPSASPAATELKQNVKSRKTRGRRRSVNNAAEEDCFGRAVGALLRAEPEGFELGPIVTAEKSATTGGVKAAETEL